MTNNKECAKLGQVLDRLPAGYDIRLSLTSSGTMLWLENPEGTNIFVRVGFCSLRKAIDEAVNEAVLDVRRRT